MHRLLEARSESGGVRGCFLAASISLPVSALGLVTRKLSVVCVRFRVPKDSGVLGDSVKIGWAMVIDMLLCSELATSNKNHYRRSVRKRAGKGTNYVLYLSSRSDESMPVIIPSLGSPRRNVLGGVLELYHIL